VRRTVARALGALCGSIDAALAAASADRAAFAEKGVAPVAVATDALHRAREFMSSVNGPPESEDEQRRLTSTLHALDHASRLAESVAHAPEFDGAGRGYEDDRAVQLCAEAMRSAASAAGQVAVLPASHDRAAGASHEPGSAAAASVHEALVRLEHCAKALDELQQSHRRAALGAVASGALTAGEAIVRVDAVRRLNALAHHAWRSAAHLHNLVG